MKKFYISMELAGIQCLDVQKIKVPKLSGLYHL